MNTRIETYSQDGLKFEVWEFALLGNNLVLDSYKFIARQSKLHKAVTAKSYSRIYRCTMKLSEVPLTDEIRNEALRVFTSKLKVQTSEEYKTSLK